MSAYSWDPFPVRAPSPLDITMAWMLKTGAWLTMRRNGELWYSPDGLRHTQTDNFGLLPLTSAGIAKLRLKWTSYEDDQYSIDPLTDHRIRLMANQIADAELERKEREAVWRAMGNM